MEYCTLKHDENLIEFAKLTDTTEQEVFEYLLDSMEKANILDDNQEHCGKSIGILLKESKEYYPLEVETFLNQFRYDPRQALESIVVWGPEDDCPMCGCEMTKDGFEIENTCVNCGHVVNDEDYGNE